MAVRQGFAETALHPLYDANGYRVSQVVGPRLAHGFPVYWVGNAQWPENPELYTAATIDNALSDASYLLNFRNYPAPDSLVLYVVPNEGVSVVEPEFGELEHLTKGDTAIPVVIHGALKFSAAYDSLMNKRSGLKVFASHTLNIDGWLAGEFREAYDAGGSVSERWMVGTIYGRGTPIGRIVHTDSAGEVFQFLVKNHLGSTVRVVNADGTYEETPVFDYQPYGELQSIREDSLNPVGPKYTGKSLDTEVNIYYFGARWYDAELASWFAPDKLAQFFNPYSYSDNPEMYVDPDGEWFWIAVGAAVFVAGVAWTYYQEEKRAREIRREQEKQYREWYEYETISKGEGELRAKGYPHPDEYSAMLERNSVGVGICIGSGCDAYVYFFNDRFDSREPAAAGKEINRLIENEIIATGIVSNIHARHLENDALEYSVLQAPWIDNALGNWTFYNPISEPGLESGGPLDLIPLMAGSLTAKSLKSIRTGHGLTTPSRYFGSMSKSEAELTLQQKYGPPRSIRPDAKTYYNPQTGRSYNVHQAPGHQGGKPHVDIRNRGTAKERKFPLKDDGAGY
jgi:RHS repeat-associated protein